MQRCIIITEVAHGPAYSGLCRQVVFKTGFTVMCDCVVKGELILLLYAVHGKVYTTWESIVGRYCTIQCMAKHFLAKSALDA